MNNRLNKRLLLTIALLWSVVVFYSSASNRNDSIAVSSNGRLVLVNPGGRTKTLCRKLPVRDIADITFYQGKLLLLSRQGVILTTSDYKSFQAFDFNSTYAGYYDYVIFTAIGASDKSICIAGEYSDGMPAVFESSTGTVWSERELSYRKDGETFFLQSKPINLEYDASHDRFIMTCADGVLFYMPGCSHCNSLTRE